MREEVKEWHHDHVTVPWFRAAWLAGRLLSDDERNWLRME